MYHSHTINNKINQSHRRCLGIVYSDKTSYFKNLLEKDEFVTIHTRNLQTLGTDMLKVYKFLSSGIITNLFHVRQNNYDLKPCRLCKTYIGFI